MTDDDIIRMAKEAADQSPREDWNTNAWVFGEDALKRFAALVAAAERNKVAAWMIELSYATGHGDTVEDLLEELEWQVRERERDACAKVCDDWPVGRDDVYSIGQAIRARGRA